RRDALAMSGCRTPRPTQNSFRPPPVPVLSTTGVLNFVVFPNCSATAVAKGRTVDEPTMRIWSRASAAPAPASAEMAAAAPRSRTDLQVQLASLADSVAAAGGPKRAPVAREASGGARRTYDAAVTALCRLRARQIDGEDAAAPG